MSLLGYNQSSGNFRSGHHTVGARVQLNWSFKANQGNVAAFL
jgi:hypothetical protein